MVLSSTALMCSGACWGQFELRGEIEEEFDFTDGPPVCDEATAAARRGAYDGYFDLMRQCIEGVAADGDPVAQYYLGLLYRDEEPPQLEEALHWLEKSAEQGHLRGQLWSGYVHLEIYHTAPEGPERLISSDEGIRWLRTALARDGLDEDERRKAETRLGTTLIFDGAREDEGWTLVKGAAAAGHDPALASLFILRDLLEEFGELNDRPASARIEDLDAFLETLDPARVERIRESVK